MKIFAMLGLIAAAMLIAGCQGPRGKTDWYSVFGDPDTGQPRCCFRAEGGNNR